MLMLRKYRALLIVALIVFFLTLLHSRAEATSYNHLTIPNAYSCSIQNLNYGDIDDDGAIDVQDVSLLIKHVLAVEVLSENQESIADVNYDGTVNVQDAALLMQYVLGLTDVLTATEVTAYFENSFEEFMAQGYQYNDRLYILVTYGQKPTPGYEVNITGVTEEEDKLVVTVNFSEADPDLAYPQVITCPYDLIVLDHLGLPIEYIASGAEDNVPVK